MLNKLLWNINISGIPPLIFPLICNLGNENVLVHRITFTFEFDVSVQCITPIPPYEDGVPAMGRALVAVGIREEPDYSAIIPPALAPVGASVGHAVECLAGLLRAFSETRTSKIKRATSFNTVLLARTLMTLTALEGPLSLFGAAIGRDGALVERITLPSGVGSCFVFGFLLDRWCLILGGEGTFVGPRGTFST